MSAPVVHGHAKSPGGGETQTATPRILAAEPGQRQRKDLGKDVWRVERKESEEAGVTLADGMAWEPDLSPMDVDTISATEARRGRMGNPGTSYADTGTGIATSGRAPTEAAWSKPTHKDL